MRKIKDRVARFVRAIVREAMEEYTKETDRKIGDISEDWRQYADRTGAESQRAMNERLDEIEKQMMDELLPAVDKRIEHWTWERYLRVQNKLTPQIEQAVQTQLMDELFPKLDKQIERWTWERYKRTEARAEELHRHLELTYRDLMVVLEKQLAFVGEHDIELKTDYPCAYESLDAVYPRGTANDNTRYPRFIKRCETVLQRDSGLSFLDLGCSGGGMVLDAVLRGHLGIGLEGSDYSLIRQRAEWRLLRNNLFTCDITKPFSLIHKASGGVVQFDVITAWEVLEHIAEDDLPRMFANIREHLADGGLFVGSIACWDDIDPDTGVNWHVTVHPPEWWQERFADWGFEEVPDLFSVEDMARGSINHPISWQALKQLKVPSYLAVLRKRTKE